MFSSATRRRPQQPPCHNFVVRAITFEGFKLRSSNLTHALLIQISRMSSIIDIVVPSKSAKMRKCENAIESDFRTSKMDAGGHSFKNFKRYKKFYIDLIWSEMQ